MTRPSERSSGRGWSFLRFQTEGKRQTFLDAMLGSASEPSWDTGILTHPEIIEDQSDIAIELAHFVGDTSDSFGFDQTDGETANSRDIFRAVAGSDSASVFIIVPIQDMVTAIFNDPMTPVDGEDTLGICLFGGSARDAIDDLHGAFATLFDGAVPFNDEGLPNMREVEIVIELQGGPDFSDFDASMVWGGIVDELGLEAILEE